MPICAVPALLQRRRVCPASSVAGLTLLLGCLLLSWAAPARAQVAADSSGLHPYRLALLGGSGLGIHYLGFRYFDSAWWQGKEQDHIRWLYEDRKSVV